MKLSYIDNFKVKSKIPLKTCVVLALFAPLMAGKPALAQQKTDMTAPEKAVNRAENQLVRAKNWMIASANPHASKAGAAILEKGGNAIDAMVAVQLVLGLVEPQSSGLGGGAYLVYWNAGIKKLTTFDGRETAPLEVTPELFLNDKGEPLKFYDAVVGGRSVGTPGTVRLLSDVHTDYGQLPWEQLFEPALTLAENGFQVSPRLAGLIAGDKEHLSRFPETAAYFFDTAGMPLKSGSILKNPAYAKTLRRIAEDGADAFYLGKIGDDIVRTVRSAPGNPGRLSGRDLVNYRIKERAPVCQSYRAYDICGMGPSSSGAITVGQILGIVENFDLKALGPINAETWRLIGDASRLAFADRGRYIADNDFVPVPTSGLLNKKYLSERASNLDSGKPLKKVSPGKPTWSHAHLWADDESIELPSTSHFSIVDREGNMLSMTTTIENGFGSRLMTGGFLLNNELTDFSFRTHKNGRPIANRVEPGKRPRSSMAPTIVMQNGKPVMAVGSPGGSRIINYVAKTLIATIDWGMNIQQAIALPHLVNRFGPFDIEKGTAAEAIAKPLEELGYSVNIRDLNSGLHGIVRTPDGLEGGADPRREGLVLGN